jgi:hypothetical protein
MRPLRVLILDEGFISGSVTARGLRRVGCLVDVIAATGGHGSCGDSDGQWRLAPKISDSRLADVVDTAARSGRYDVIYPVTEPFQQFIWALEPEWEPLVFPGVDHPERARYRNKREMSEHVAQHGIRVPDQLPASCDARVVDATARLGLPIVIKGVSGRGGQATFICDTASSACAKARELRLMGAEPFAQRFIAGTTYLAGGLFDRGRPLRFFAGRKVVQYPPRTGPAAEIVSDDDRELVDVAMRIFAATEVTGLASIDLIRDESNGFQFLELNPRPWGSIEAASVAGVDLFEGLVSYWRAEAVPASVAFTAGRRVPIFPLYLLSADWWRGDHIAASLGADVRSGIAFAIRQPRQALHQLHRLFRVGMNWSQPLFHK